MRTIQVINTQWYNATAWYALYLAKILNEHGHKSLVITSSDSVILSKIHEFNVDYISLPLNSCSVRDICRIWKELNQIFKDFHPDIVNCHRGESFYLFGLLKKKFGYALVRTRGDQRFPKTDFLNKYLHNALADCIITSNSGMAAFFAEKMQTPAEKIHTILGGVDTKKFYPQDGQKNSIRTQYGFGENDILLGIIGRLEAVKGFHESVRAFAKALQQSEEAREKLHLLIAGRPCAFDADELKNLAKSLSVPENRIHFFSFVDDINSFINMLDMGVIASVGSEAIARVAFEMLACHIPVIGSCVGVMPDILEKEYLFQPGNIEEMAAMFLRCLNRDFRQKLTEVCMNRFYGSGDVHSVYGWTMEDFYKKTMNVYLKTLEGSK